MIASASEAKPQRRNYVGVAFASLVGMNLSAKEMLETGVIDKERYEDNKDKPVTYLSEDGKYRLDFHLKIEEDTPLPVHVRMSVYVSNTPMPVGRSSQKVKVMNQTQNFAWVSPEDLAVMAPQISPKSIDGTPWFTGPYRPAVEGEEELYTIVKLLAGARREESVSKIDIPQIIKGNYRSIGNILAVNRKNSFIKVMLGEQVTDTGMRYQCVWKTPMSQYAQDNAFMKMHADIVGYLASTSKRYEYGISQQYSVRDMLFREARQDAETTAVHEATGRDPENAMPELDSFPRTGYGIPTRPPETGPGQLAGDTHDDDLPF